MSNDNRDQKYYRKLDTRANTLMDWPSGYTMDTELIQQLKSKNPLPWTVKTIDLSTAKDVFNGDASGILSVFETPCWMIVPFFYNTGTGAVQTNGVIDCFVNDLRDTRIRLKHGRHTPPGPLFKAQFGWAAQAGISVDLVFQHFNNGFVAWSETCT